MAHSIIPPSGAAAWVTCHQWVKMNQLFPQDDSESSKEGVAAHWVAAELIAGRTPVIGAAIPNNLGTVTAEMIDGAQLYWDAICSKPIGTNTLIIENTIPIPRIHSECYGTPDLWVYDQAGGILYLFDYKFGHRFVDEYENYQLIAYVAGILDLIADRLNVPVGTLDVHTRVAMTIVQPRCYSKGSPVRTWETYASDLRGYINRMHTAAHIILAANDEFLLSKVNPACQFCPGRHACPTLQNAAYDAAALVGFADPGVLPINAASLELFLLESALDRLTARVEGLQEQVAAAVKRGEIAPFHRLHQSDGKTIWNVPDEMVLGLGQLFGIDLVKNGVKTPSQAKKLGIDADVINAHTATQAGSVQLVPVNNSDARRVFAKS